MKTAIISGSAGNLGSAIVEKFQDEGYRIIGIVSTRQKNLVRKKDNLYIHPVDLTDEDSVADFFSMVLKNYGCPDLAVLTAGGFVQGDIEATETAELIAQYKLNFLTAYNLSRLLFVEMVKNKGGRIYLTGSRTGMEMKYSKGMVAYGLSKSLVFRFSELMNAESKNENFLSSVIVPSTIDTPQNRASMPLADFNKWSKPADIADIIVHHYTSSSKETIIPV